MVHDAIEAILNALPPTVGSFAGSQYPLPVAQTFRGNEPVDLEAIRCSLLERTNDDPQTILAPLLIAAEQIEAVSPDKAEYFLDDQKVQSIVFTGSKWRAGWALVLGNKENETVVKLLTEKDFMVFTDQPGIEGAVFIGGRDTSPIYFLQLMVRYGLVWGRIAPGKDHEMGHFLERDMPGFLAVTEDLPPVKYLVTLGLMKLGAPAVVPPTFPFPYGTRVVARTSSEIIERGSRFPNLRQRYYRGEVVELPSFCNPAWGSEQFEAETVRGGDSLSFFCVRPAKKAPPKLTLIDGNRAGVGILVKIADDGFSDDIAQFVEKHALKALSYIKGVRPRLSDDSFALEFAQGVMPTDGQIAEALIQGIRVRFPGLQSIGVTLIYDEGARKREAAVVRAYKEKRRLRIEAMTEGNTKEFCVCIECRTFSLVHTCIATPEREPMCASRTYASIKAAARFDSADVPWKRPSEKDIPLRSIISKGAVLDAGRGEYQGCNEAIAAMTSGQINRVFLHSLREHPHTSCGCFQTLAFWIPKVEGIGIMLRNSKATEPGGKTWAMLANSAGGKQTPGITGVSLQYIRSPTFLRGDGGLANVVWVDSALYEKISGLFASGQKVATEKDVSDVPSLRQFLGR
jgi:acetyl-CoA decarbonylase/synthase, CODH/ACS complex subunit beta